MRARPWEPEPCRVSLDLHPQEAVWAEGLRRRGYLWVRAEWGGGSVRGLPTLLPTSTPDLFALLLWPDPPLAGPMLLPQSLKQRDVAFSPY